MKPGYSGIKRLYHATRFSWQGIRAGVRHEAAIRQELTTLAVTVLAVPFLRVNFIEGCLLVGAVLFVLLVELLNSAVEATVDLVTDDYNDLAARAKDMGSAAVLVSICLAVLVFAGVFRERLLLIVGG